MNAKRGTFIRQFRVDSADLVLDKATYDKIMEDMQQHAGMHKPSPHWQMGAIFSDSVEKQENPNFEDLMARWIGKTRILSISQEDFVAYRDFLVGHDQLGFLNSHFSNAEFPEVSPMRVADLRTIMEVSLISEYSNGAERERALFLEVGGGYGRLAEAFLNVFQEQVKYVMIDTVPASLYYAYAYLTANLPDRRIGFYYQGDEFDLSIFDCYIIPAWHFEALNNQPKYDVMHQYREYARDGTKSSELLP